MRSVAFNMLILLLYSRFPFRTDANSILILIPSTLNKVPVTDTLIPT